MNRGARIIGGLGRVTPDRLRARLTPPLGHLQPQHEPRPLTVPRSYVDVEVLPNAPRISVVVPSLNYGSFIGATLASLLDQEYPGLEVTVCDGGSTDATESILEAESARLTEVHVEPGDGQAPAINRGFTRSSGEIMSWLNADDLLLPGSLAYVGAYFARNPDVDMVYGHRLLIDEAGRDIGQWVTPPHSADSLQWFDFIPQETAFWRRSLWDRVGGLDTDYELGFDWDLFLRFHVAGAKIVRLPRFLGAFRQHDRQKTRVYKRAALVELEQIRSRRHGRSVGLDEAKAGARATLLRSIGPNLAARIRRRLSRGQLVVDAAPRADLGRERESASVLAA